MKKIKRRKSNAGSKKFNYYQVILKNNEFNLGAFPPTSEGLASAKSWAEKMSEETGAPCVVKKK